MPRKVFTAGEILTAADVNTNLMDQAVMSFAGTAARGSAIPSPVEGMVTYLEDVNGLTVYDGSAWVPAASGATLGSGSILQVVSTTKTDTFSTNSTTFTAVTGLSASITPKFSSSKILVIGMISQRTVNANASSRYRIMRDSTAIAIGDAAGSRDRATGQWYAGDVNGNFGTGQFSPLFLDSPSTTSSVTYSIDVASSGTIGINTSQGDGDNASEARTASTITLMEVAG